MRDGARLEIPTMQQVHGTRPCTQRFWNNGPRHSIIQQVPPAEVVPIEAMNLLRGGGEGRVGWAGKRTRQSPQAYFEAPLLHSEGP